MYNLGDIIQGKQRTRKKQTMITRVGVITATYESFCLIDTKEGRRHRINYSDIEQVILSTNDYERMLIADV